MITCKNLTGVSGPYGHCSLAKCSVHESICKKCQNETIDPNEDTMIIQQLNPNFIQKAISFTATVLSGAATRETFEKRLLVCNSCPNIKTIDSSTHYCQACKCPENYISKLETKLQYKNAKCPLGLFQ